MRRSFVKIDFRLINPHPLEKKVTQSTVCINLIQAKIDHTFSQKIINHCYIMNEISKKIYF